MQHEEQRFPRVTDQQGLCILPIDGSLHLQKPEPHPKATIEILKLSHVDLYALEMHVEPFCFAQLALLN